MAPLKKIYLRMKLILRNNILLIPNLFKGDLQVKTYVLRQWFMNNLGLINPLHTSVQNLILMLRVEFIKRNFKGERPIAIDVLVDNIDLYYINLEHRVDRRKNVEKEFEKLGLTSYHRFNAIQNNNGTLGCALSNKAVLESWSPKEENLLMVCEDDISFLGDYDTFHNLLYQFINNENLDVMCLGYNNSNGSTFNESLLLTSDTQTKSCYILKPHMRNMMIQNFSLSIKLLRAGIDKQYRVASDQVWKVLQKKYNFVIPKKRFAYQRESFSDIENRIVDYKV
jgi:GR25 family glycosyltransferase involved in LPS biosynthesis